MISLKEYLGVIRTLLNRTLNPAQLDCLHHDGEPQLLIVAGPGSGKTTVLVLRALRHVFVDGELPERLLITTFTKKAAKELRTRWLDWGNQILNHLSVQYPSLPELKKLDLNRCRIDTLDSIAQQALSENKLPGEIAIEVIEEATANLVLKRRAFTSIYNKPNQPVIDHLLTRYGFDGQPPGNRGEALRSVKLLCDRLTQDRINLASFASAGSGQQLIVKIAEAYWKRMQETGLMDFAALERQFLDRIRNGMLRTWVTEIGALLIDEYQDTNPLQEDIYFELISRTSAHITVVGDDDQAMYRFRGGSVELFTRFPERSTNATGRSTRRVDMVVNYRSSGEIVAFYNRLIGADPGFAAARVSPPKPEVTAHRGVLGFPVLGLFKPTMADLAQSLSAWLDNLLKTREFQVVHQGRRFDLTLGDDNALGDCVLLSHTVDEVKYQGFGKNAAEQRFPGFLRDEMEGRGHYIFNPRGRTLRTIKNVQVLLGLLLLAIDPDEDCTSEAIGFFVTTEARFYLNLWRAEASQALRLLPTSRSGDRVVDFVGSWQQASRGKREFKETEWPVLELLFKLIAWLPDFQNDPEHQVWLEAIMRAVTSAGIESPYGMQIHQRDEHRLRSRQSLIRDALVPIAEDEVAVDEDIMPSVPRNRLQVMTIHQSKGLEFPLVIVDVGSAFTRNHPKQAFRRFPNKPSNVTLLEDDIEPHLIAPLRTHRNGLDRTFDDLVRLHYVAYSRPQSVLLLVGCEKCLAYGKGKDLSGAIPHIGLGWLRDRSWPWRQAPVGKGKTPVMIDPPFANIT